MNYHSYGVRVLDIDPAALTVNLRVFLVHYELSWKHTPLLPDDRGFFFGVLREAADGTVTQRSGALGDLVSPQEYLNMEWVDANASRFVAAVTRMATRNQPRTDDEFSALAAFHVDHFASLDALPYQKGAPWSEDHRLVQADCQVRVTDPRWLAPLERGQGWCTLAHPSPTGRTATSPAADPTYRATSAGGPARAGAGGANLRLGHLSFADGDLEGAHAAYLRAVELGDPRTRVQALLALDGWRGAREGADAGPAAFRAQLKGELRSALELCVRLQEQGEHDTARAAYWLVHTSGSHDDIAEVRRRAGMETPAERGYRLAKEGNRSAAAAELRLAYEPATQLPAFALALFDEDFDAAQAVRWGSDLELAWARRVAIDLAFHHARAGNDGVEELLNLRVIAEDPDHAWRYALGSGSAFPEEAVVRVGKEVARCAARNGTRECVESIGKSAEPGYPPVAATAFFLVGQTGWWFQVDPAETVAAWSRAAYWECVSELGDAEAAAWSTWWLAWALAEIGDDAAARAVYQVVSEVNRSAPAELARTCRETGAAQDWGSPEEGTTSPEGSRDTYAVVRYALWLDSDGLWLDDDDRAEQVRALLLKAAAGTGRGASRATLELGLLAEDAEDADQAREWWLRTVDLGDPALAMEATRHLGWLAKGNDDVPETLRWFKALADADHPDAPWAAAQLGDLYYWRDDQQEALGWYRRALDGADDPEVVGEAALRAGEILSDQGETRAARTVLMRGIESGDTIFVGQARELLTSLGAVADG